MIKSTIACRNQSLLGFFFCFLLICISPPHIYIIYYTCTYVKLFKKLFNFAYKNAPYFYRTFLAKYMFREFVDLFPLIIAKFSTLGTGSAVNLWRPHGTTRIELVTRESCSLALPTELCSGWRSSGFSVPRRYRLSRILRQAVTPGGNATNIFKEVCLFSKFDTIIISRKQVRFVPNFY